MRTRKNAKNDRLRIGIFLSNLIDDYQNTLWSFIEKLAFEKNIDIITFVGGDLATEIESMNQRNSVFYLANKQNIDGLIILTGTLINLTTMKELTRFIARFSNIPIVSIGVPIKDSVVIKVDNSSGIKAIVTHLVKDHGRRKLGFIRGSAGNPEAELRYKAFCAALKKNGLTLNQDWIAQGTFWLASGEKAILDFRNNNNLTMEAIVCANDDMARGAINELMRNGVKVPEDIAVTGFDDKEVMKYLNPPLTTIRQPLDDMALKAIESIIGLINKKSVPRLVKIKTQTVLRASCGCFSSMFPCEKKAGTRVTTGGGKSGKKSNLQVAESVLDVLAENPKIAKNKPSFKKWLMKFIGEIELKLDGKQDHIAVVLNDIVSEAEQNGIDVLFWNEIQYVIFNTLLHSRSRDKHAEIHRLALEVMKLIAEIAERIQANKRLVLQSYMNNLHTVSQTMISSFNEDKLIENLSSNLHSLGISGLSVFLNTDGGADQEYFRELFYFQMGKKARILNECFLQADSLLARFQSRLGNRYSLVLISLYVQKDKLGLAIFERNIQQGYIYENLGVQLSNTLLTIKFFNQIQHQALYLEKEVEIRTQNLNQEISVRIETEKKLQHEKEMAQVTLKSIGDGVIVTDLKRKVTYLNPIAENLTGWTHEDASGVFIHKVLSISGDEEGTQIRSSIKQVLDGRKIVHIHKPISLQSRDGNRLEIKETIAPILRRDNSIKGIIIVIHNVSDIEEMSRQIDYQRTHDALTGLYNRQKFEDILSDLIRSLAHNPQEHSLVYIDLDRFRLINESIGTVAGDELLKKTISQILKNVRGFDVLARLGSDHFGLLMNFCSSETAMKIVGKLCQAIHLSPFEWNGRKYKCSISAGICNINIETVDAAMALGNANIACSFAKQSGGNQVHLYHRMDEKLRQFHSEIILLPHISKAIEENRFCLYKQKIQALDPGNKTEYCEILIRMLDESKHIIPPQKFIGTAERYDIMHEIDAWVIHRLFSIIYADSENGSRNSNRRYSVNLSGKSLNRKEFLGYVLEQFELFKIPPSFICFEITETQAIQNFPEVAYFIKRLKKIGCFFALDDFGSGWTSFSYLKLLPVDYLKIDGSFVKSIASDKRDFAMVKTIHNLGRQLGLKTIAEYVENDKILEKLYEIGVNFAQGYGIEKPCEFRLDTRA
ncbi:MAG: EAL domain-containing protein [Spirochaetales bacterium]|nr:EAL domain-containing protein [Spirochaetales bacterium]